MSGERWRTRIRQAFSRQDPLAFVCECGKTWQDHQTHGNGAVSAEERQSGLGDDGLTDEERQEFLSEFQRGIGSKRINDGATGAERGEG